MVPLDNFATYVLLLVSWTPLRVCVAQNQPSQPRPPSALLASTSANGKERGTIRSLEIALIESQSVSLRAHGRLLEMANRSAPEAAAGLPELLQTIDDTRSPLAALELTRLVADLAPYSTLSLEALVRPVRHLYTRAPQTLRPRISEAWTRLAHRAALRANAPMDLLIASLLNPSSYVRELSADLLARHGTQARSALPALRETLASVHPRVYSGLTCTMIPYNAAVRDMAAAAMISIAPYDPIAFAAHVHRLFHGTPDIRRRSALALGRFRAARAVPVLEEALLDNDCLVVREAITALSMTGSPTPQALLSLRRLASHEDKQIAMRARAALKQLQ